MKKLTEVTAEQILSLVETSNSIKDIAISLGFSPQWRTYNVIKEVIKEYGIVLPPKFGKREDSVLRSVNIDTLQSVISKSSSYSEVLRSFDLRVAGCNLRTLKEVISSYSLDVTGLDDRRKSAYLERNTSNSRKSSDSYDGIKNKNFSSVRKYIIKNKLLEYKCQIPECGNIGIHCGKPLTLELDHIDGDRHNNELDNLRFLCPSCHSQTETFAGKSRIKKVVKFCKCGTKLSKDNLSGNCSKCASATRSIALKFEVSKEELTSLVTEHSLLKIGEMFGVSDNAVRKRCVKLGVDVKSLSRFSHKRIVHTQKVSLPLN